MCYINVFVVVVKSDMINLVTLWRANSFYVTESVKYLNGAPVYFPVLQGTLFTGWFKNILCNKIVCISIES